MLLRAESFVGGVGWNMKALRLDNSVLDKNGRMVDKIGHFPNLVDTTGTPGCFVDKIGHAGDPPP